MSNRSGLRERKKLATRQSISDVATRLFVERGFDAVTLADIAEAAEVAKMTVFNYFPRKEDLFFDRQEEGRDLLRAALARRVSGRPPILALRDMAHALASGRHPAISFNESINRFWTTVEGSAALTARARELRDAFTSELAELLAISVGKAHADGESRLGAGMFAAVWSAAYQEGVLLLRGGATPDAAAAAFLSRIDQGVDGIMFALRGTPYGENQTESRAG